MKIKKGDKIIVMTGKDKGRKGLVEKIYKKTHVAIVTGINQYKRHVKKNEKMPQGGIVEIPRPIDVSKISLICPKCGKIAKIGYYVEKNLPAGRQGKKIRICKKCQSKI